MSDRLVLASTSRSEDGAYLALADVVAAAEMTGTEYRIIGGHMVNIHVARCRLDLPPRGTGDADVGLDARVLASSRLVHRLHHAGYQLVAGNRLERGDEGTECAIDVLVPADTSRLRHNRPVGELFVDEVPGLGYALARPSIVADLEVALTTGGVVRLAPAVPDLVAALCLKVLAFASRAERRDALDVWRLLEVARAEGLDAASWPSTATPTQVARLLRDSFMVANGRGVLTAAVTSRQQARVRALAVALAGG